MLRLIPQVLSLGGLIQRNIYTCYIPHLMTKHFSELTIRATRRQFLNKAVLNQSKDVIHAEIRKPTDFVLKLKQEGNCPGVILPHSKNKDQEIDIVLPGKTMKARSLSDHYPLERVYVRVEGKDYHCVLSKVQFNVKNFIEKVYFKEYVAGKANYFNVPINITHLEMNKFYHAGFVINTPARSVDIISYNHEYPTKFYVDISYVNIDRPYRVGDLANTFPPGIILNPKVDPNNIIFSVELPQTGQAGTTAEQILANINYGKEKKEKAAAATGAAGTTAAGGKGEAVKGGDAAKTAGKAAPAAKTDAKAAPAGKKK